MLTPSGGSTLQHITWRFDFAGEVRETPMVVRWIYKTEFCLLARLTGFRVVSLYSGFNKADYHGNGEMVWVLEKDGH
jgi:hypothetical protein